MHLRLPLLVLIAPALSLPAVEVDPVRATRSWEVSESCGPVQERGAGPRSSLPSLIACDIREDGGPGSIERMAGMGWSGEPDGLKLTVEAKVARILSYLLEILVLLGKIGGELLSLGGSGVISATDGRLDPPGGAHLQPAGKTAAGAPVQALVGPGDLATAGGGTVLPGEWDCGQ